jgi:hypothetical protein
MQNAEMNAPLSAIHRRTSHAWLRFLVPVLVCCACGAVPLRAASGEAWPKAIQIEEGVPVKITYDASFTQGPESGFLTVKIVITNGTTERLAWRASLVKDGNNYGRSRYGIRFGDDDGWRSFDFRSEVEALEVPAGATREFNVALPVTSGGYGNLRIDGPHVQSAYAQLQRSDSLLADSRLADPFFSGWDELNKKRRMHVGDISHWSDFPEDWKAYAGFRLLILKSSSWAERTGAQRSALVHYVATGGTLVFVGEGDEPTALPAEFGVPAMIGSRLPGVVCGLGLVDCVATETAACVENAHDLAGRLGSVGSPPWLIPLPDWLVLKLPRAALIVLLLVSALLAGPGALFWLAKRQQRHRLFLVLPAIAAGTTLVLLALIFINDGTGGEGRRTVLAALVDGRPEMAVYQQQSARCGFLFRTDFTLPADAMASMSVPQTMAGDFMVERTGGECRGDWFRNRSVTAQTITHTIPTRAALELRPGGDGTGPTVVSTFPAPLRDLVLVLGPEQKVWRAAVVSPGAPTRLVADNGGASLLSGELLHQLNVPFHGALDHLVTGADLTGRFFAATDRLEGAPIPTLASIRWTDTILVTGRCSQGRQP